MANMKDLKVRTLRGETSSFWKPLFAFFFTLEGVVSIELWKILDVLFVNKWSLNWICFKLDGWENQAPSGS